jgi:Amt family ammonium transporter
VHGVGGILGTLLVAVLATPALGGAGYAAGVSMGGQALTQAIGVVAVCAWSAIASFAILFVTRRLVGLRAQDQEIEEGLDFTYHGERGFQP